MRVPSPDADKLRPALEATRKRWVIIALLFFFMFINFADKAVIGLAGVPIMRALRLTPQQFGLVGSSFFFLFSVSAVVTGFIANRIQSRWVLLAMALIWALTQFPMLGTVTLPTLIACRVVLGAGEGPAYPVALHAAFKWFPNEQRTLPSAIISQGAAFGVVLALPALDWVIEHISWNWAFGVLGIIGLAWCAVWLVFGAEGEVAAAITPAGAGPLDRVPYSRLLLNPTTFAAFACGFGAFWGLSLLVTWFTPYLIKGLGFSQYAASWLSTLPWAMSVVAVISIGWLSQRLLAEGVSTRVARSMLGGGAVALGGLALILMPLLPSNALKIAAMVIGTSVPSVIYVMGHAILGEFTPVRQRGAMLAINNAVYTSAGLLAPYIMGSVVASAATPAQGYERGFVICGIVALIGGVIGLAFLRPQHELARLGQGAAVAPSLAAE
jgi:MFS transporter, ACS family, D-galactonate transporter